MITGCDSTCISGRASVIRYLFASEIGRIKQTRFVCVRRPAVAVKSASTDHGKRQLRMESRFLAALSHRAIVRAHGLSAALLHRQRLQRRIDGLYIVVLQLDLLSHRFRSSCGVRDSVDKYHENRIVFSQKR